MGHRESKQLHLSMVRGLYSDRSTRISIRLNRPPLPIALYCVAIWTWLPSSRSLIVKSE